MSNKIGSFLETPQIGNEACKTAAILVGDCLRTKAGLERKSSTTDEDTLAFYESAKRENEFTEDQISKFEDRLTILLIRKLPLTRKLIKFYDIPELIAEAADFEGFEIERDQLPNRFQIKIHGQSILLLSIGSSPIDDDVDFPNIRQMVYPVVSVL